MSINIEIIKQLKHQDADPCFEVKSTPELLTYILLNQDKVLNGFKIVMIEAKNDDGLNFDLQNPILLLQSEIKNIENLQFNNKFDKMIKE